MKKLLVIIYILLIGLCISYYKPFTNVHKGEVWIDNSPNPFEETDTLKVIDVKDGYVKYESSKWKSLNALSLEKDKFKRWYKRIKK